MVCTSLYKHQLSCNRIAYLAKIIFTMTRHNKRPESIMNTKQLYGSDFFYQETRTTMIRKYKVPFCLRVSDLVSQNIYIKDLNRCI